MVSAIALVHQSRPEFGKFARHVQPRDASVIHHSILRATRGLHRFSRTVDPLANDLEADAAIQAQRIGVLGLDAEADQLRLLLAEASARFDQGGPAETDVASRRRNTELRYPTDVAAEHPPEGAPCDRAVAVVAAHDHHEVGIEPRADENRRAPLVDRAMDVARHVGPERVDHAVQFLVVDSQSERHGYQPVGPHWFAEVGGVTTSFEFETRPIRHEPDRCELTQPFDVVHWRLELDAVERGHAAFQADHIVQMQVAMAFAHPSFLLAKRPQRCQPDRFDVEPVAQPCLLGPGSGVERTHCLLHPFEFVTQVVDVAVGSTPPSRVLRVDDERHRLDIVIVRRSEFDMFHRLIVPCRRSGDSHDFVAPYHRRMARLRFGTFLAPHHPTGEHPTLQFQRDIDFAEHLDRLGFDEFWCGEHHSSGWEMIASPEMFLAGAAQRTGNIMLGTGVTSLPYHHPFNVAQRIVQLDHMSRGRAMFGSGPGALASDARTLGIDPMVQRDRQDEALGVITRLLRGEDRFSYDSEWFTLNDARLQLLPLQEELPMVTASSISPSGMTLAGKYGMGVLSIASNSTAGLQALPTQWGFAEDAAAEHGRTVDRKNWRVMLAFHIAESREQARNEAVDGLHRWHNEYNVWTLGRPNATHVDDKWELLEQTVGDGSPGAGAGVIGTPDDLVAAIRHLQEITGGFGVVLGFAHDWANREATMRSWDLVARYVIPELNGYTAGLRESQEYLNRHQAELMAGASKATSSLTAPASGRC